jgi:hypothetical protein
VQDRRWIGQSCCLKEHTPEFAAAVVEVAQQRFKRIDEVAPHRAAQASGLQQHHIVADVLDQQMIERHLAEFVDDDGGLRERGILQQPV